MNGSQQKDPLNAVLLDARKELHGIQASLRKENVNYSDVLNQLSNTTGKYQSEAESLLNERYSGSTVMPLQATLNINVPNSNPRLRNVLQKDEKKTLIQQIRSTSPQEIRPFKTNRAMDLRTKTNVRAIHASRAVNSKKVVPPLKNFGYDETQNVLELMEKGIIRQNDDIQSILPGIDTTASSTQNINSPFFPNLQIDISGAARSYKLRKEQKQREIDEFNAQLEKALNKSQSNNIPMMTTTPSNEKTEDEFPPTSPSTERQEKTPEIQNKNDKEEAKVPGPRVYEDLQDEFAYQTLLVVRGKIARDTPDFESFQRTNSKNWEKINKVMDAIENFCEMFDIQFAEINGRKLGEASRLDVITFDDVYSCLVNIDEFIDKKRNDAAKVIQKNVKIYLHNKKVNERKILSKAAYKIQNTFRNYLRKQKMGERNEDRNKELFDKATFLTETFKVDTTMNELLNKDVVSIHVLASLQDLTRTFSLLYKNMEMIIIMPQMPPPHIWEDLVDFFAQNGIPDVNERTHFILLREMNSGDSISHRLQCDMKSITKIQRILKGRLSYIVPHSDWFSEQRLSADLKIPIFGIVDTTDYQSRAAIKNIFNEAHVHTPISTREYTNVVDLLEEASQIISDHPEIDRYIIRYGFSQNEKSIAYFDATPNIRYIADYINRKSIRKNSRNNDRECDLADFIKEVRDELKCNGCSVSSFFKMVEQVGAIIEVVPPIIHSFPSVSLMLSGDKKIHVIGTFDRMHYSPFHFACSMVPSISVDPSDLICKAKQAASVLIKRGIIGHVTIDFISFDVGKGVQFVGFDIRTNSYPSILYTAYLTLCAGFNEETGKMCLIRNVGDPAEDAQRYCVVQSCVSHPGMALTGMNDIRKTCYAEGLFFDLLKRTGFKFIFFDTPSNAKGFALMSANTANTAISLMMRSYAFLLKYFGMKAGTDSNSSLVNGTVSLREFKKRIYPDSSSI